jgi:hypothetical protein
MLAFELVSWVVAGAAVASVWVFFVGEPQRLIGELFRSAAVAALGGALGRFFAPPRDTLGFDVASLLLAAGLTLAYLGTAWLVRHWPFAHGGRGGAR